MSKFEQLYRDVLEVLPTCKRYRDYNEYGRVIEAWDKDDDGNWKDVTLREQERERLEIELAKAKREAARLMEVQDA